VCKPPAHQSSITRFSPRVALTDDVTVNVGKSGSTAPVAFTNSLLELWRWLIFLWNLFILLVTYIIPRCFETHGRISLLFIVFTFSSHYYFLNMTTFAIHHNTRYLQWIFFKAKNIFIPLLFGFTIYKYFSTFWILSLICCQNLYIRHSYKRLTVFYISYKPLLFSSVICAVDGGTTRRSVSSSSVFSKSLHLRVRIGGKTVFCGAVVCWTVFYIDIGWRVVVAVIWIRIDWIIRWIFWRVGSQERSSLLSVDRSRSLAWGRGVVVYILYRWYTASNILFQYRDSCVIIIKT
jgi:hypothetical protein